MGIFTDKKMEYDIELLAGLDMYGNNSITLILEQIKPKSKVLEFGPAYGRMTKYLKEQLGCRITCVELNEKARESLEQYADKVIIGDIEDYEWESIIGNETYDAIIFADVLEHLYNPKMVLERTKKFLKQEGYIYISIPNISHSAVLQSLYNDEFEYQDYGLLDETHIRFFTKKSFERLIQAIGLHIVSKSATYYTEEMANLEGGDAKNLLFKELVNERSQTYAYQYIYGISNGFETCADNLILNQETLKIYIDFGNGFCEKCTYSFPYEIQNRNQFEIEISENSGIRGIRIDPLDTSCAVKLNGLKVFNEKMGEVCLEMVGDYFFVNKNTYLFPENDPKWVFKSNTKERFLRIFLDLSVLCTDVNNHLLAELYTGFYEKKMEVLKGKIEEVLLELEQEKRERDKTVTELEKELLLGASYIKEYEEKQLEKENEIIKLKKEIYHLNAQIEEKATKIEEANNLFIKLNMEIEKQREVISQKEHCQELELNKLKQEKDAILWESQQRGEKLAELEALKSMRNVELLERGKVISQQKALLECKDNELYEKDEKIAELVGKYDALVTEKRKKEKELIRLVKQEQKRRWKSGSNL